MHPHSMPGPEPAHHLPPGPEPAHYWDPTPTPTPAALVERLHNEGHLTLTGPPGAGKSHLAARVAQAAGLPVHHVDLARCRDSAQVPRTVADAVGADTGDRTDPLPELLRTLAPQRGLLVLDTCEHVAAGTAHLADRIRDACPKLQLIATSRQPLGTVDESLVGVAPLTLEQTEDLLQELAAAQEVDLPRAWAHLFALRIDGNPLAAVFVAHALHRMGPRQLFARLTTPGGRFAVLTDGPREPERHRTLWRAIEWSYQLCRRPEQLMWFRLSAFSCAFTRDQVQLLFDVRDELDLLIRSSIVLPVSPDRYRLPLAHREFGRMQVGAFGLYESDGDT